MGFLHNIEMKMEPTMPKSKLKDFLDEIPDDALINTEGRYIAKDRPYESDKVEVTLRARWVTE